jgi:hypothetical protein
MDKVGPRGQVVFESWISTYRFTDAAKAADVFLPLLIGPGRK